MHFRLSYCLRGLGVWAEAKSCFGQSHLENGLGILVWNFLECVQDRRRKSKGYIRRGRKRSLILCPVPRWTRSGRIGQVANSIALLTGLRNDSLRRSSDLESRHRHWQVKLTQHES